MATVSKTQSTEAQSTSMGGSVAQTTGATELITIEDDTNKKGEKKYYKYYLVFYVMGV